MSSVAPARAEAAIARARAHLAARPGQWILLRVLREESRFGQDMGGRHDLLRSLRALERQGVVEFGGGFDVNQHWRGPCKVRWKMPEVRTDHVGIPR